jgi:hypothetical protein
MDRDEVLQPLFDSWVARLSSLGKLQDGVKTQITKALKSTPFSQEQIKSLAHVVLTGGKTVKISKKRRPNQKCPAFENYVPEEAWLKMRSGKLSRSSCSSIIAAVSRGVGIELPDEGTLFRMVSIIAYCLDVDLSQQEILTQMDKIKDMIQSVPRIPELEFREVYPDTPGELPTSFHAYYGKHLPPSVDIPELDMVLAGNKKRGRPKSSDPEWLQNVPEEFRNAVRKNLLSSSQAASSSPSPAKQPLPQAASPPPASAECLRFSLGRSKSQLAIEGELGAPTGLSSDDLSENESSRIGTAEHKAEADETIEELERTLLRKSGGKKAKDDAPSSDLGVKKRPASACKKPAASTSVLKKPASQQVKKPLNMKDVFKQLIWDGNNMTRKAFTSRAYHAGEVVAKHEGIKSKKKIGEFARTQSRKASKIYSNL